MLNAPLSLRLTLVEKLASMLDPGHLALTQSSRSIWRCCKKWITASTLLSRSSPANCRFV
ncbi:diguanylate cyclase regulator RdcB family protein [Escherichia coli]